MDPSAGHHDSTLNEKPEPPSIDASNYDVKVAEADRACDEQNLDVLVTLATSKGGLVNDTIRRRAWPLLIGCSDSIKHEETFWSKLPVHKDEDQVQLDVNRSFVYYPTNESPKQLDKRKKELSNVITEVLRRHPELSYFQGFHDIVQVVLLVLGPERASEAVARISLLRIRDFMLPSMTATYPHLKLLPAILSTADTKLYTHIKDTQPFYAISATLTLYAHDIQEYSDIARLFDFIIAHEAVMSIYLFATIILSRKTELLEIPEDEPEMLHFTLSKLPQPLNLEGLISGAKDLFRNHPPESLPFQAWSSVSNDSVLKTTRNLHALVDQSLDDGSRYFERQVVQLRRQEAFEKAVKRIRATVWAYRRPTASVAMTIAIGLVAYYLGRPGSSAGSLPSTAVHWILRFLGGQ